VDLLNQLILLLVVVGLGTEVLMKVLVLAASAVVVVEELEFLVDLVLLVLMDLVLDHLEEVVLVHLHMVEMPDMQQDLVAVVVEMVHRMEQVATVVPE
jgi:hypothetical protein